MDRREFALAGTALAASAAGLAISQAAAEAQSELAALGQRLAMARERKGLTVAECCNRLGVDPDAWQRWESGQEAPLLDVGCQAAKHLGVDVEWLADGEGAMLRT